MRSGTVSRDDADVNRVAVNPHNFGYDTKIRHGETLSQKTESARALFESSVTAQENRVREFKAAKLIHASPVANAYLLTFGRSLAKILRKSYSGEEFERKKNDMFRYYRDNQSGAVRVEDNLFLHDTDKSSRLAPDTTLRELGASLAQTVAIGENKEFLRMLRKIADDSQLREQLKQHVDIDFFDRLCNECGCDDEGLPKTDAYRVKLYKENNDLDLRMLSPVEYRVKEYPTSTLHLSPREAQFVKNQDSVKRATGGQLWRISPDSEFAKKAVAAGRPTTAGPSGTTFHIVVAAKLMAPALREMLGHASNRIDGAAGWKEYSTKLLMTTLMGYLHGEREADHHHSMDEVLQGAQRADTLIRACYSEQADSQVTEAFGFDKYRTEDLLNDIFQKSLTA